MTVLFRVLSLFLTILSLVSANNGNLSPSSSDPWSPGKYHRGFGAYIGRLRAYSHGIAGQVYAVDDRHLFIRNFRYEKSTGPDAYFWVGAGAQPDPNGQIVPYPPSEDYQFGRRAGGNQLLGGGGVGGGFTRSSYNVGGSDRDAQIEKFNWINGLTTENPQYPTSPGVQVHSLDHLLAGATIRTSAHVRRNRHKHINSNNNNNNQQQQRRQQRRRSQYKFHDGVPILQRMRSEDVLLPLPNNLKLKDIDYLSIWAPRFTSNYGDVYIPKDIQVPRPMTLGPILSSSQPSPYAYDPGMGRKEKTGHLKSGRVTILDEKSFYIPNLYLRALEKGYRFWSGVSDIDYPSVEGGFEVADEKGRTGKDIRAYSGQDLVLTLPGATTMFEVNFVSVLNPETKHSLGHIMFNVTDEQRIPPALGQTKKPGWWFEVPLIAKEDEDKSGTSKPTNEPDSDKQSGSDYYDVPFNHNMRLPNCREMLGRKIRLLWRNQGHHIYFRVKVHMGQEQFAAVGITATGSPTIDADVVKIFYNATLNRYVSEDSFLSREMLCDFSDGLCSDTSMESRDDVRFMGSHKALGLSVVDFRRTFPPGDVHDAPIAMDGPTQIVVAIGSLASKTSATNHYDFTTNIGNRRRGGTGRSTGRGGGLNLELENTTIDFSIEEPQNSCPDGSNERKFVEPDPEEAWDKGVIKRRELLNARLGPAGGRKGYSAITGNPASLAGSVVWWINDLLMPEIFVERGKTYYFRVQGGDNPNQMDSFHPFYITDNAEGGYGRKSSQERKIETIYAGVDQMGDRPTGIGPLCELVVKDGGSSADSAAAESASMSDFRNALDPACQTGRSGEFGWVNWTVAENTPDLVYYQSYSAFNRGWKIRVVDEGAPMNSAAIMKISSSFISATKHILTIIITTIALTIMTSAMRSSI